MVQTVQSTEQTNYVVCLKWGDKYSPQYVNNLFNMVDRNITLPYEFVCYTDDTTGINSNITTKLLPRNDLVGWWYKPLFFNPQHELQGQLLFLDLDMVVYQNIDKLFTYEPNKFAIIRDFNRQHIKSFNGMNSSVFRVTPGQHKHVYHNFVNNPTIVTKRWRGDQDYLFAQIKNDFTFWPDEWIQSYKWEMRSRTDIKRDGRRRYLTPGEPKVHPECSIAVFHGEPNPHECTDQWVKNHWG